MVSPKAGKDVSGRAPSQANGAGTRRNVHQLTDEDDPMDDLDLEDGPLLNRNRQTFEVQGYQGNSDSADYAAASGGDSSASILGGAYAPAEKRRRWCAGVLSVLAAVLIVATLIIGGFGLYQWREQGHSYGSFFSSGASAEPPGMPKAPLPSPASPEQTPAPTPQPTPAPTPAPTPQPTPAPTPGPTPAPTKQPAPQKLPAAAVGPASAAATAAAGPAAASATAGGAAPAPAPQHGSTGAPAPKEAQPAATAPVSQPEFTPNADDTFNVDTFGDGNASSPYSRWIYKLPHTWTEADYDAEQAKPGELAYSHMAMLTHLPNGSLASLMQASPVPGEGNEQQALYWQVSDDWGLTWSAPRAPLQPVNSSSGRRLPMWSPVTHTRGGRVFLFFSVSVEECAFKAPTKYGTHRWTPGGNILMAYSDDNGDTWSEPKTVLDFEAEGGVPKVIANKLAIGTDGGWLLPFWRENDPQNADWRCNRQRPLMGVPAVLHTRNEGTSWEVSQSVGHGGSLPYNWMVEPSIVGASAGVLHANPADFLQLFRTEAGVPMYSSRSVDGGATWSVARPTALPNPNSKVHAMTLPSGAILLAFDDSERLRTPLALAMSRNGGETWVRVDAVEGHPCGQFSYPTLQYVPEEGRVFVAYTVLFLPSAMSPDCKQRYGKTASNTTDGLPASGMRIYATTETILNARYETAVAGGR